MKKSRTHEVQWEGKREGVGCCGFVWVHSHNAPLCVGCSAGYGPILPHIRPQQPLHHQICSGATETARPPQISFLFFKLVPSERKGPPGDLVVKSRLSCSGNHVYYNFKEWILSTCARRGESHEEHMDPHLDTHVTCSAHGGIHTATVQVADVEVHRGGAPSHCFLLPPILCLFLFFFLTFYLAGTSIPPFGSNTLLHSALHQHLHPLCGKCY